MNTPYPVRAALTADLAASGNYGTNPVTAGSSGSDKEPVAPVPSNEVMHQNTIKRFSTGLSEEDDRAMQVSSPTAHSPTSAKVTEFDMAAYSKEELNTSMQKRIIARMFDAFDVTQRGYLDEAKLKDLCEYVGRSATVESTRDIFDKLHSENTHMTFDKFWTWWQQQPPSSESTQEAFSLVSADFAVLYHQQQLEIREEGEIFTPSFRISYYFKDLETGFRRQVSPWHDMPLFVRDPVRTKPEHMQANRWNFICEIPKWTRAKFEIATGEAYNPIRQDIKDGVPRFYKHGDMMWNYGAMPQTWESTEVVFEEGVKGDNDPLDAVEIGMCQMRVGEVHPVRVLGVLGMIDEGQMDWKVIVISVNDPIARFLKDISDVPKHLPGCLDALREWFRVYKICQGGYENRFAFDGEFKNKQFAMKIVQESHYMWENLRKIQGKEKV